MQLLSALYTYPPTHAPMHTPPPLVHVPLLWPLMLHTLGSVRLAAVQCLRQVVEMSQVCGGGGGGVCDGVVCGNTRCLDDHRRVCVVDDACV